MVTIDKELKELVFYSVKCLGNNIKLIYGDKIFQKVEKLRLAFKSTRDESDEFLYKKLIEQEKVIKNYSNEELLLISKSFTLMLELINCCEIAFRKKKLQKSKLTLEKTDQKIIFVLTSHPTEARSESFLDLTERIIRVLEAGHLGSDGKNDKELNYLLGLALQSNITKEEKPTVKDEANQIYHVVLKEEIIKSQVEFARKGVDFSFRAWPGGDKDGHPGVGPKQMLQSLMLSRKRIIRYLSKELTIICDDLHTINQIGLAQKLDKIKLDLKKVSTIRKGDGLKVKKVKENFLKLEDLFSELGLFSDKYQGIKTLFWIYPALVIPLELREDSELLEDAIKNKEAKISQMLIMLKNISSGHDPKWYVRGFIISMCEEAKDLENGYALVKKYLGSYRIPVVPLFENEKGLMDSTKTLQAFFSKHQVVECHEKEWNSKFEIMIGYSDSSKESGVLYSRVMLESAVKDIDKIITRNGLRPVFFHGSGGSVTRGGGSIRDQIAWWPKSALEVFKTTIQGESIQRSLSDSIIIESQLDKIISEYKKFRPRRIENSKKLKGFLKSVQSEYQKLVSDNEFKKVIFESTLYLFLEHLKFGSRPTKRSNPGDFSLRAIPWVLCWTQSRLFLPMWWGLGKSWHDLESDSKKELRLIFESSPLLLTFIKQLGFTLEKIEFAIWNYSFLKGADNDDHYKKWVQIIGRELELAKIFFEEVSGHSDYIWHKPWLKESIRLRSSLIHPLGLIQQRAIQDKDSKLLRLTVTGVACGMLTTG